MIQELDDDKLIELVMDYDECHDDAIDELVRRYKNLRYSCYKHAREVLREAEITLEKMREEQENNARYAN